ncbi:UDP-glucose 4-epimerase, partial [Escherichia coli]
MIMILVTGGAGYVGSHTVLALLNQGINVTVIDNLSNSSIEAIRRIEKISNKKVNFVHGDINNRAIIDRVFGDHKIKAVMHFAALKSVSESVKKPLNYYQNNVSGTITLLEAMQKAGVNNFIFSSSATVYGSSSGPN